MIAPDFTGWLDREPYALNRDEKSLMLTDALGKLTHWHASHCEPYARILEVMGLRHRPPTCLEEIPFIPVRLFKEFDLLSIGRDQVFKTMTSSGTTGQQVSRIYLDRETASFQSKVLARIMSHALGKKRLPMLVIDSPSVARDRSAFSARGAGIRGFSLFGQDVTYALTEEMELDFPAIEAFLERHAGCPVFIFGFTFMIWQHFYLPLRTRQRRLPIDHGILLHGGGWKRLQDLAVGSHAFRAAMLECAGIRQVINYYGMVEQTGAIHLECEQGHLHAPIYADIIVRDPVDFSPLGTEQPGLIEVMSLVPRSYPGHALLTEDMGTLLGEDDCPCGRLGKYFQVSGRVAKAEARGCSDTYETHS